MAEMRAGILPRRRLRRVGGPRHDGSVSGDYSQLPDGLPVPVDDGAADGLVGREVPGLALPATMDAPRLVDLAAGLLVAYVYPMTGTPGRALPRGWDDIPGARGCTPQSCAYRDALAAFERLGAAVVGISVQSSAEQAEFAAREHIPFPLLSDEGLRLREALGLPTFEVEGRTLYRRLTFVAAEGRIVKVFYPVFPPDRDAAAVLAWLGAAAAPDACSRMEDKRGREVAG
jgi:peroxiredoxin